MTIVQADPTLTNGDLAVILPGAGIAQGLVSFLGKLSYLSIYITIYLPGTYSTCSWYRTRNCILNG